MTVEKIMTSPAHMCSPEDNLRTAAQIMWDADCGCVVVTDDQRAVGVITDRDICMAGHLTGSPLGNIRVADVMSASVCTCKASDSLDKVAALMAREQLRRLPVTDKQGKIVGVVSINDLALAAHGYSDGVSSATIANTLAAISEHRPNKGSAGPPFVYGPETSKVQEIHRQH